MRFIAVIIFALSIKSYADQYKMQRSDYYPAYDINEISNILSQHKLIEFDLRKKGNISIGQMDQIYFNPSNSKEYAVLKLDLISAADKKTIKLSNDEFVCHTETTRKRAFALYVKGRSHDAFLNICNALVASKNEISHSKKYFSLFFSFAYASDLNCSAWKRFTGTLTDLKNNLNSTLAMQKLGTCLSDAASGAGGVFTGIKDGFTSLLNSSQDLWGELSLQAKNLLEFITHLKNELMEIKNNVSGLDDDLLFSLGCHLGGELLVSAGATAIAGYGAVKLSTTISAALLKLKNMKSLFHRLNKLNSEGKGHIARGILNCAVN